MAYAKNWLTSAGPDTYGYGVDDIDRGNGWPSADVKESDRRSTRDMSSSRDCIRFEDPI
jgi:hypothetical protein